MNEIEQVIAAATRLEAEGRKISTATVKSSLTTKVSLPAMIEGIKRFQGGARLDVAQIDKVPTKKTKAASDVAQLKAEIKSLQKEVAELRTRLDALEKG
ncbi:hypothetical protein [Paraferrimonas sedimenticola]|uniref:Replication region DNA-binding N-term n=1 Tax=Paraferrimonas sedimenticola TaxID=375674 RepID=A0AA37RWX6_9GAMM|nr:hypothetical protein [Paraferrimonas sedimenticola]GLP96735.1 hypothetical protein GCM10007895_20410 [Paraferrimonas sedimenticola]